MKLYSDKLDAHLKSKLAPVYLLFGDEPLQIMEAGDKIRACARDHGFDERTVIQPVDDSDWSMFREAADSLSLFAERRIIELRLPTGKPGRVGGDVLKQYCSSAPDDVLLLISSGKLDRSGTNSAWFKAIDKVGVTIAVYPLPVNQLGGWLKQRLASHALQADDDALALIVERVEGNLLAAQQEVERLALLYPQGRLTHENVMDAVADSARYSIGDLSLAALNGQARRALRVLAGLRDEAVAEVLILWSLSSEVRAGARAAEAHEKGVGLDSALKSAGVWQSRAAPLKTAISRHDARSWLAMLSACSTIDRQIKGQAPGSVWDAFESLVVQLASRGEPLISKNPAIPS
ncbi:MAG: DNA polymerase III subunit delta [Granulosicoccus sp.]